MTNDAKHAEHSQEAQQPLSEGVCSLCNYGDYAHSDDCQIPVHHKLANAEAEIRRLRAENAELRSQADMYKDLYHTCELLAVSDDPARIEELICLGRAVEAWFDNHFELNIDTDRCGDAGHCDPDRNAIFGYYVEGYKSMPTLLEALQKAQEGKG